MARWLCIIIFLLICFKGPLQESSVVKHSLLLLFSVIRFKGPLQESSVVKEVEFCGIIMRRRIRIRRRRRRRKDEFEKLENTGERGDRKTVETKKATVVPVVIGAVGAVSKGIRKIGVNIKLKVIQKTALLGTAPIISKHLVIVRAWQGNHGTFGNYLLPAPIGILSRKGGPSSAKGPPEDRIL